MWGNPFIPGMVAVNPNGVLGDLLSADDLKGCGATEKRMIMA